MTKKRRKKDDWREEAFEFDSGVWDAYSHDLQRELNKRRNKPRSKGKKTNMKRKKRKAKQRRSGYKPATRTRRKRSRGLSGVDSKGGIMQTIATKNTTYGQVGFSLLAFSLGTFTGSLLGKGSGWAGAALSVAGIGIKNLYVGGFGAGVLFSRMYKEGMYGTEGVDGLETIKARAKAYFSDLKDKFLPEPAPQVPTTTEGLNGERVSYFVNPAKGGELDLSELDKISQQVTQMNQGATVGNLDPGDRNY